MPKTSKSSASSATRKKHARKAAGPSATEAHSNTQNTKSKPSKKEIKKGLIPPPKKSYIPPSKLKPAPVQIDPLDHLAPLLPSELVFVLRKLAKKDGVTKSRALEELEIWVRQARKESRDVGSGSEKVDALVIMLPVWLHRYSALCVHQSRRIRYLAASLHALLLELPVVRSNILMFLRENGSEAQVSQILGSWCLSAWDVDRGVAARGMRSWKDTVDVKQGDAGSDPAYHEETRFILDDLTLAQFVLPFIMRTVLDPSATHAALNPSSSTIASDSLAWSHLKTPPRGTSTPKGTPPSTVIYRAGRSEESATIRSEDDPESAEDRTARLRVGAMGVLRWIFDTCMPTSALVAPLHSLLSSPMFWTVLHHADHPPFLHKTSPRPDPDELGESSFSGSDVPQGFGARQTIVRRAGWGIVQALIGDSGLGVRDERLRAWVEQKNTSDHHSEARSASGLISSAVLRSAFVEPDPVVRSSMWQPLSVFLTKVDDAWLLNLEYENSTLSGRLQGEEDDDTASDSSASAEETDPGSLHPILNADQPVSSSAAYDEFLAFLSLGCNGSPIQGYPTTLVILSTIPIEILRPTLAALSGFFDALWAAIDGQALSTLSAERARRTEAFLEAWGQCLFWTSRKLVKGLDASRNRSAVDGGIQASLSDVSLEAESPLEVSRVLVSTQFQRLTAELGKTLRLEASVAGIKVAVVLERLENVSQDLLDVAWMAISTYTRVAISDPNDDSRRKYALTLLAALHKHLPPGALKRRPEKLVSEIAEGVVSRLQGKKEDNVVLQNEDTPRSEDNDQELIIDGRVVEMLLEQFGSILAGEEEFTQRLDALLSTKLPLLFSQPSLILSYLRHRSDITRRLVVWHLLLSTLGSSQSVGLRKRVRVLDILLDATSQVGLAAWANPLGKELEGLVGQILTEALGGDPISSNLVTKLLLIPGPFIDDTTVQYLISTIVSAIDVHIRPIIQNPSAPLETLRSSLALLLPLERDATTSYVSTTMLVDVLPHVFALAFVMPRCFSLEEEMVVADLAKQLWEAWRDCANDEALKITDRNIKIFLKDLVIDTDIRPRPLAILQALLHLNPQIESPSLLDVVPTQTELGALLSSTSTDPIDSSLAILEPLAPSSPVISAAKKSVWNSNFDDSGFSPYARGVSALLHVLTVDRHVARENMWAIQHTLTLALFASEVLQVPSAGSPVFKSGPRMAQAELREITRLTRQVTAFLLTSAGDGSWHKDVVGMLSGKVQSGTLNPVGEFVRLTVEQSRIQDTVRDSLVLHTVLQHVLPSATKDDADLWLDLARSIEEEALQTSLAISLAVTEFAPEPPKLDRFRNELASKLAGIPSSKANDSGLRLLRRLSAVAPNPDSEVIFLPQQRAVYLVQTLQVWLSSDEDLDESVESEVTYALFNLAPILQNVQGAHWEFIMDLIESNIENSSLNDTDTLVLLFRTLRLLTAVRELSLSNKYLRELWQQRFKAILALVRDLLTGKPDRTSPSVPLAMCREQALLHVQNLPASLMDENTLSTMCHLISDPCNENQKLAYQVLQQAAIKRTEHLVIEAGVDLENNALIELPHELVALLQSTVDFDSVDVDAQSPLAYLLSWVVTFDLFTDASLKVKTAYVDQLRDLNLIGGYFLPNTFDILGVGNKGGSFKLDPWAVDEYWLPLYDPDVPQSLQLLAAHVYYRALLTVPSLIRSWWEDLKDRQLSAAVVAFTSSYFSPVLIASELIHIKPSSRAASRAPGDESLADETFHVKVALAINDVTATFNVDDQQMEIGIKLPVGYPLKTVDVRPIRRVGVPEKVWRKWLFAVQQVVTSHNGRIVDGLTLFKKTVSLHFEGQVECAICYSILHVVDRSLPTKPCKTCRNRFHAGCLYKWFNTSHSSSCPLCRSDIM